MKALIEQSKLVIFDLDGTLYEGTAHFDYYAIEIGKKMNEEMRRCFCEEYEKVKTGNHILQIGKVYDMNRDCILTYDPFAHVVTAVHTWDGQALFGKEGPDYYEQGIVLNEREMIAIGDGWWYTYVTGAHFGVRDTYDCYNQTKAYMASDQFLIPKIKGLKEVLVQLKPNKHLVLMTNSDREDVTRLLKLLDLEDVFTEEITSAEKPMKTEAILQSLMKKYNLLPHEMVSIGDNFINEVAPALKLGVHGVYIAPQGTTYVSEQLLVILSLAELVE